MNENENDFQIENLLFTEKYRPKNFDEFIGNEFVIEKIKKLCENPKNLPNFLFVSRNPGTGKTTLAKLIVLHTGADYIFLNASDERGINTIREKVKKFISSYSTKSNVPKIVIMDESDSLTIDSQEALRSMIEMYSKNARFIFTANYEYKIIPPIRSRCLVLNLSNPEKEKIKDKMKKICEIENIKYNEQGLNKLIDFYYPDMRKMLIKLQDLKISNAELNEKIFLSENEKYDLIFNNVLLKNLDMARTIWINDNIDLFELLKYFYQKIYKSNLPKDLKNRIILVLSDIDFKMNLGADSEISFTAGMVKIINLLNEWSVENEYNSRNEKI
jgi:replication factor C small subunit